MMTTHVTASGVARLRGGAVVVTVAVGLLFLGSGCTAKQGPRVWVAAKTAPGFELPKADAAPHEYFRGTPIYVMHTHDNTSPTEADLRLVALLQNELEAAGFAVADSFEESGVVFMCRQSETPVNPAATEKSDGKTVRPPGHTSGELAYKELGIVLKAIPTAQVRTRDFTPIWEGEVTVLPEVYERRPAEVIRALLQKLGHNGSGDTYLPATE